MFATIVVLLVTLLVFAFLGLARAYVRQVSKVRELKEAAIFAGQDLSDARASNARNFSLRQLAIRHLFRAKALLRRMQAELLDAGNATRGEILRHDRSLRELNELREVHRRTVLGANSLQERFDSQTGDLLGAREDLRAANDRLGRIRNLDAFDNNEPRQIFELLRDGSIQQYGETHDELNRLKRAIERIDGFAAVLACESIMTGQRYQLFTSERCAEMQAWIAEASEKIKQLESRADEDDCRIETAVADAEVDRKRAETAERLAHDRAVTIGTRDATIAELRGMMPSYYVREVVSRIRNLAEWTDGRAITSQRFKIVEVKPKKPSKKVKKGGAK